MEQWLVPSVIAVLAVLVAIVDCIGVDHIHKRSILARMGMYSLVGGLAFGAGWLFNGEYHLRNLEPNKAAANEAIGAEPDGAKFAHDDTPPSRLPAAPDAAEEDQAQLTEPTNAEIEGDKVTASNREPTLSQIHSTVAEAPPLRQKEVGDKFVGTLISWDVEFLSEVGTDDGLTRIMVRPAGTTSAYATIEIDLEKHKYLLDAPKGAALHVDAVIESVGGIGGVELKDASVRPITIPGE